MAKYGEPITLDEAFNQAMDEALNEAMNASNSRPSLNELPLPWAEFNERASRWFRSPKPLKRYSAWDTHCRPKGKYAA